MLNKIDAIGFLFLKWTVQVELVSENISSKGSGLNQELENMKNQIASRKKSGMESIEKFGPEHFETMTAGELIESEEIISAIDVADEDEKSLDEVYNPSSAVDEFGGLVGEMPFPVTFDYRQKVSAIKKLQSRGFSTKSLNMKSPYMRKILETGDKIIFNVDEKTSSLKAISLVLPHLSLYQDVNSSILKKAIMIGVDATFSSTKNFRKEMVFGILYAFVVIPADGSIFPVSMMFSCRKESLFSWAIINQLTGSLVFKDLFGDNRPTLIFDMEKGLMNSLFTVFGKDTSYVNCAMHLLKNLKRLVGIEKYWILGENFRTFRKEYTFERLNSNFVEQHNLKVLRLRDNSVVPAVSSIF